jgi:hypothetical protein
MATQLFKKFHALYGTQKYVTHVFIIWLTYKKRNLKLYDFSMGEPAIPVTTNDKALKTALCHTF